MKIFVLLGESGSGKDSIAKELINQGLLTRAVTTTTRPPRPSEVDGVDYNFVTEKIFRNLIISDQFIEFNMFKDWYYGLTKNAITNSGNDNLLVILNPKGFKSLYKHANNSDLTVIPIYIHCSERKRLIRTIERDDNVEEIFRRFFADREDFKDIVNLIHQHNGYMVFNESSLEQTVSEIKSILCEEIAI